MLIFQITKYCATRISHPMGYSEFVMFYELLKSRVNIIKTIPITYS